MVNKNSVSILCRIRLLCCGDEFLVFNIACIYKVFESIPKQIRVLAVVEPEAHFV